MSANATARATDAGARPAPRPYLQAAARREYLLQAAGGLVRDGGWTALSMQALAAAAEVSRQLVYAHFGSAEELSVATLTYLFERAYVATAAVVRSGARPADVLAAAYDLFLDLPAEEQRALRALASEECGGRDGLGRARSRLRNRVADLWLPYVRRLTGLDTPDATALVWMMITASWSLADTIAEGVVSRDRSRALFVRLALAALSASRLADADHLPGGAVE